MLAPCIMAFATSVATGADVPAARPAEHNTGANRLPEDAARMYGFVMTPHPGELR